MLSTVPSYAYMADKFIEEHRWKIVLGLVVVIVGLRGKGDVEENSLIGKHL